jgi:hypothetical protein
MTGPVQRGLFFMGISINPNRPVGMDLEPEMVQQLKNN